MMRITSRVRYWITTACIASVLTFCLHGCTFEHNDDGTEFEGLRDSIRRSMCEKVAAAVLRCEKHQGREFHVTGKYFLDSLKPYLTFDSVTVYVYQDSIIQDGQIVPVKKHRDERGNRVWFQDSLMYLGIGSSDDYMCRIRTPSGMYLCYTVGANGVDELGMGDDKLCEPIRD